MNYAYTLNLGYHDPQQDFGAALLLSGDTPSALRLLATTFGRVIQQAYRVASYLEAHPELQIDGMMVCSEVPLEEDFLTPVQGYIPTTVLAKVFAADVTGAARLEAAAPLTASVLADAFALIERHEEVVRYVLLSARRYADLRKFTIDLINTENSRARLKLGIMGSLWGASLIVSSLVPADEVHVLAEDLTLDPAKGRVIVTITR